MESFLKIQYFLLWAILLALFLLWQNNLVHINLWAWLQQTTLSPENQQRGNELQEVSASLRVSPYGSEERFLDLINSANYSIHGERYSITLDEVKKTFRKKSAQGVDMKIMLENKMYWDDARNFKSFQKSMQGTDIKVKNDETLGINFLHVKSAVIDKRIAYISTSNLSYSSFHNNREYMITTENTWAVGSLDRILEKDWNGQKLTVWDVHPNLMVCPIDCRSKTLSLIDRAEKSLSLQTQYIQDKEIIEHLMQAKSRGVVLQIIVSDNQEPDWLESFGTGVRIQVSPYVHAKTMLIDDRWLMVSSMNFSTNALDNNREIGIVITNQKSLDIRKAQFLKDWNQSKEYDETLINSG